MNNVTRTNDEEPAKKSHSKTRNPVHTVVSSMYRTEIDAIIAEETDDPPGSPGYISSYPGARSTIMKGFTKEQWEEVWEEVKRRSETGAPRDEQRR